MKAFQDVPVYVEGEGIKTCCLVFDEKIVEICDSVPSGAEIVPLPKGCTVYPGFIDEHVHGAGGADTMDGSVEALSTFAQTVVKEGTTSFLPTTMTQSKERTLAALAAVKAYREGNFKGGATVLGVHLEGPFIAEKRKGAQPKEYVQAPSVGLFDEYDAACGNCIKIVTLAPEEEGADAFIKHLCSKGVVASVGHSDATYGQVVHAAEAGLKHVTHTYNAQSPLHHREIGVVGSALLCDGLRCELIADTVHVCVPAMKLLAKCKKEGELILITDAMRAKGLADGESELGGQTVVVKNGEARLKDGTLAGSVLRMNVAVKNLVEKVGVPVTYAVDCATKNPAQALGIYGEAGSIRVGKRADFAVLNEAFDVCMTVCGGEVVYRA